MSTFAKTLRNKKFAKNNIKTPDSDDSAASSDCDDYETLSDESSSSEDKKVTKSRKRNERFLVESSDEKSEKKNKEEKGKDDKKSSHLKKKKGKGLILVIGGGSTHKKKRTQEEEDITNSDEEEEDDDDDDSEYYDTEDSYDYYVDDLEEYNSETEEHFMKETYDKNVQSKFYKKPSAPSKPVPPTLEQESADMMKEYNQLQKTKRMLSVELKKRPNNKICKNALENCNQDIQSLIIQQKKSNFKAFHDLLYKEREQVNENKYFIEKLSHKEQMQAIEKMEKYQQTSLVKVPYRFTVLKSTFSQNLKSIVLQKIAQMESMEGQADQEYHKLKNWVDTFMKIPFGKHKNNLVQLEKDGIDACHAFMNRAQEMLNQCTYGLKETKMQIMQMLGNWITNPQAMGTAIAIKGPPGTGKTSLVKEGVSKILGRDFVFIPLGGSGDGSFLEGHSYTYEGSTWGKIVQSLMDCQSMNPVFYFDELDKVSESVRGQEIINILIHLTDTTQNTQFTDKYFSEINELDLSKCLFIFSYNDETKVNPILLNRMHVIHTQGYNVEEKLIIGKNYLLPKITEQINIRPEEVVLTDSILKYILNHEQLCKKEDGVRNFKRALEMIFSKLNLYRIMKSDSLLFQEYPNMPKNITFPHTVTQQDLDILIKNNDQHPTYMNMYI